MDIRHVPGIDLSGFFIPGNNGLPDLYVNANDPADWVTMQIAARSPAEKPTIGAEAAATIVEAGAPDWLKKIEDSVMQRLDISSTIKGAALSLAMLALAVALILLGAYKLTQD